MQGELKKRRKMKETVEEIHGDIIKPSSHKEDEQLLFETLTKIGE